MKVWGVPVARRISLPSSNQHAHFLSLVIPPFSHLMRVMMVMMLMSNEEDDAAAYDGVDRQLVRMGYRFLVRGCKGL